MQVVILLGENNDSAIKLLNGALTVLQLALQLRVLSQTTLLARRKLVLRSLIFAAPRYYQGAQFIVLCIQLLQLSSGFSQLRLQILQVLNLTVEGNNHQLLVSCGLQLVLEVVHSNSQLIDLSGKVAHLFLGVIAVSLNYNQSIESLVLILQLSG